MHTSAAFGAPDTYIKSHCFLHLAWPSTNIKASYELKSYIDKREREEERVFVACGGENVVCEEACGKSEI